jgi:hypothetical protein
VRRSADREPGEEHGGLTGVILLISVTPMPMTKTQVYFRDEELSALHEVARKEGRPLAELIREAVRTRWLRPVPDGPVALWTGPYAGSSTDHDGAFDDV